MLSACVMVNGDVAGISCYLSSIMPRFKAMVTACVRSFVPSFERILLMRPLTVSSTVGVHNSTASRPLKASAKENPARIA
jgi:hypothetical protein